jgi:hypothetical protein
LINAFALNSVCLKADTPKPKTFNHINEVRVHLRLEEEMKKLLIFLAVGAVVVPVLVFSESSVTPPIPHLINYQGMLTDDLGNPLNDTPDITFEIWNAPSGGTKRWWETQSNVSVTNGLFNVILGNVNPINLSFYQDENYWLQIIVEEDTLPSRLKFTSVAFAYRAQKSDTAAYAISGGSYSHNHDADYVNVIGPDSIRSTVANQNVFSVKSYGTGDANGIYIRALASSADGIVIDTAGNDGLEMVNIGARGVYMDGIEDNGIEMHNVGKSGIYMAGVGDDGIYVNDAGGNGLFVNLADNGVYIDSTRAGYHGIWVERGGNNGVYVHRAGYHGVSISDAGWDGFYLNHADIYGLYINDSDDDGIRVANSDSDGIEAYGFSGGGEFYSLYPLYYAVRAHAYKDSSQYYGLYVYGSGGITGTWSTKLSSPSGDVPGYMVTSRDVELMASGTGNLVGGQAQITFDREFQEAVSPEIPIRVVVTAQGAPSALLYVDNKSTYGFAVKQLEIPGLSLKNDNVSFDWIAIARQKGYEQRPQVLTSDEEKPTDWVSKWQEERKAEELKHQQELQQDALYRQQIREKQALREARRIEQQREEQEKGESE